MDWAEIIFTLINLSSPGWRSLIFEIFVLSWYPNGRWKHKSLKLKIPIRFSFSTKEGPIPFNCVSSILATYR